MKMKNVMTKAWEIARNKAKTLGGKASEYISHGMKVAWEIHKFQLEMRKEYVNRYIERFNSREEMAIATLTETGDYRNLRDEDHIEDILNGLARIFGK